MYKAWRREKDILTNINEIILESNNLDITRTFF